MSNSGLPTGTVTFLFTDIEGSTKRWEEHPQAMRSALSRHNSLLQNAITEHGGYIFKTVGDAFYAAFSKAPDALAAALQAQRAFHNEEWDPALDALRVRLVLHVGTADLQQDGDYLGQPLNRIARLLSAAHGGQTLLSDATYNLVRDDLPVGVELRDLGEHRLKDLQRPERVFQLVVPGLPSNFPHLKTLDTQPNNLPVQHTEFIGREKEVAAVVARLSQPRTHLITLTGPGGVGKTRLGLQAAAKLLDEFEQGVFFVNLALISDPEMVVPEVARTLRVREGGGQPLIESVKEYLREKHMLLLLDNFEQVTEAAPVVNELLEAAPHIKVLVTSRVALHLRGEKEFPVPPMGVPPVSAWRQSGGTRPLTVEDVTQYEAVRLFIERATYVEPEFRLTNENARAVAEICARLDGLPLALELAAARMKYLPPQAILSRLTGRLKLLTGGARDLPARQQTLRRTVEWSYDLLSEEEKRLFRRLAVFVGGRTLEAIEEVCNAEGDLEIDVLDGVSSLVDKNLLRQEDGVDGEPRFLMLETIHEYAKEKLEESGEGKDLRRFHAQYFVALDRR